MLAELIVLGLALGVGYLGVLLVDYTSHVYIHLFPQILELTFWQAMVTHHNLTWLWMKYPQIMFWVVLLFTPLAIIGKASTDD